MEGCNRTYRIEREEGGRSGATGTYTHIQGGKKHQKHPICHPPSSHLLHHAPPLTLQDYHAPLALQTFLAQQPLLQQSRGSPNGPWIFSRVDPSFESLLCHCRRSWRTRDSERETLGWNPRGVANLAILSQDLAGLEKARSFSWSYCDLISAFGVTCLGYDAVQDEDFVDFTGY